MKNEKQCSGLDCAWCLTVDCPNFVISSPTKADISISNFQLVCYYDNKTNELSRIECYNNNDTSIQGDIDSYKYGYNAQIVKPEQLIKQLKNTQQECECLRNKCNIEFDEAIITRDNYLEELQQKLESKQNEVNEWKHQAELGVSTTDRLEKELNQKELECDSLKSELMQLTTYLDADKQTIEELKRANEEKNELLAKLGCPTVATARGKVHVLEHQIKIQKARIEELVVNNNQFIKDNEFLAGRNSELKKENEWLKKNCTKKCKADKYYQTIRKIEEIAKAESYLSPQSTRLLVRKILEKISECEE